MKVLLKKPELGTSGAFYIGSESRPRGRALAPHLTHVRKLVRTARLSAMNPADTCLVASDQEMVGLQVVIVDVTLESQDVVEIR